MVDSWVRSAANMSNQVTRPMSLRLILQPVMASIFAIIAGLKEARRGQPPCFRALFTAVGHRAEMLTDGRKSAGSNSGSGHWTKVQ
jgi:hypothetical protein